MSENLIYNTPKNADFQDIMPSLIHYIIIDLLSN